MPQTETARIADQLRRAVQGPAWHGPALAEAIAEVTADEAAARPLAAAHSIHELVAHAVAWIDIVRQRVEGRPPQVTAAMDWPPVSADRWDRTVGELQTAAHALEQTIRQLDDGRLTDEIPIDNDRWSVYQTLHGAIQHVLYHAGQIGVLKKGL